MSSDPTTPGARPADPAVAFTVANRAAIGWVLVALGLIAVGAAIYFTVQAVKGTPAAAKAADAAPDKPTVDPLAPKEDLASTGPFVGALVGYLNGLILLGLGLLFLAALPKPTEAERETDARVALLTLGGLFGGALVVSAVIVLFFGGGSMDLLLKWINERTPPAGAWRPVACLLVFVTGAALAFLAAQPARAEERNNATVRRLVYGLNLGLTSLLLLAALAVGNVVAALKVPNKLDTTENGFYSLSPTTREYLAGLTTPVKAYTTIAEDEEQRGVADVRRLLTAAQDVNPAKFQVKYLSPVLNKGDITALRNKYPQADLGSYGVLLTAGEDEKQYAFLRVDDLFDRDQSEAGRGTLVFRGEAKLVQELLFLSENKTKPVVYVSTGHGELEVTGAGPGGRPDPRRSAAQLRTLLEKSYVDVRPLEFDLTAPKVPDDATLVAILDPRTAVPPEQIEAIRKFLTTPNRDGKKGKLIVASSPHPKPDGTGVADTGLDPLLAEFGVRLGHEYIYNQPAADLLPTEALAAITNSQIQARNPIALDFQDRQVVMRNCREVASAPPGAGPVTAEALLGTYPGRITWLEADPVTNPQRAFGEMMRDRALIGAKQASNRPRSVAVVASEGSAGRAVVFGSGEAFADPDPRAGGAAEGNADLFVAAVNWLRDRPAAANIASKPYGVYVPPKASEPGRAVFLPVGATLLGVAALGLGVWMFRRK